MLYTGKRKRDSTSELIQYLERADESFLQHSKEMEDALLQEMRADTRSLLGLMGRMVAVTEAQSQKLLQINHTTVFFSKIILVYNFYFYETIYNFYFHLLHFTFFKVL